MALPRYSLAHNAKSKKWELKHEGSGEVVKSFATKAKATKGGVLEKAVGKQGSVRIRTRRARSRKSAPIRAAWIRAGQRASVQSRASVAHSAWRRQVTRWSLTMPVACMKA